MIAPFHQLNRFFLALFFVANVGGVFESNRNNGQASIMINAVVIPRF